MSEPILPQTPNSPSALVTEVGGTHVRFALTPLESPGELFGERTMHVRQFPTVIEAVDSYLSGIAPDLRPKVGIAAVAGPAIGDAVKITNAEWVISSAAIAARQGLDHLYVINDVAAIGWGIVDLTCDDLLKIGNDYPKELVGKFAAIGSGTGLGVSAVTRDAEGRLDVTDTEGGHVDFASVSVEEDAILAELRKRFGRVSCERLLSGEGLVNIFEAIAGGPGSLGPENITAMAAEGDHDARRAIDHFCAMLGTFAGNVALMHNARDGIFLAGGMLRAMSQALIAGKFRERFEAKGRFGRILADIPTVLILDPLIGLRGAAVALREKLQQSADIGSAGLGRIFQNGKFTRF